MIINDLYNNKKQGMAEGNNGQDINDPLDPNYGYHRNLPVKRKIQFRLGHDQRGDARVRAGQPRSTHARHKPQLPESAMDDNAIWNQYGHYNAQDLMQEFPNLSPKDAQVIVNYAEYGWSSSNPQKFRNEVVKRIRMAMDQQGISEDDGFNVVSNYQTQQSTDTGNKVGQTYTGTTVQKNPATGQQKSLAQWDHTDPATGKNYSGSTYIDAQGNVETQKNYEESKNKVNEVSLGDYRKKAMMSKAMAQTNQFFGRDDPATVAAADQTIAKRERGLARADTRTKPYTPPSHDAEKYQRELTAKYPNIDELVVQAERNRDPDYQYAEGEAYYRGREAEHEYQRLKQIQRVIQGLNEMDFAGVSQTTDSDTGDITTSFNQGPMSVSQTKTPGGYTKQTDQRFDLGPASVAQKTVGPNIGAGQLAGTTTRTATNNMTGQSQQQVRGVGFGGASGANVGKNFVGASDDELAQHAAGVFKENVDRIRHLAGIKPVR